jgi:hypothetical protein
MFHIPVYDSTTEYITDKPFVAAVLRSVSNLMANPALRQNQNQNQIRVSQTAHPKKLT